MPEYLLCSYYFSKIMLWYLLDKDMICPYTNQISFLRRRENACLYNALIINELQNGPFRTAKWAVLACEMGRIATRNGPFRKMVRTDCRHGLAAAVDLMRHGRVMVATLWCYGCGMRVLWRRHEGVIAPWLASGLKVWLPHRVPRCPCPCRGCLPTGTCASPALLCR